MFGRLTRKKIGDRDGSSNPTEVKKIAIVGLPNTGKSQVFNNLSGKYTLVANYPLTTVEVKKTRCQINGQSYEIIDTPGLHCLYIHSEEELQVRDMIFSEKPDVIIQCIDANQLKQSLTLTADLLELEIPMVISLNAIDETAKKGIWIDSGGLSRVLGVLVIESIAVNGIGTNHLKAAISKARIGKWPVKYGEIIDSGISAIAPQLPEDVWFKRKAAVLLLLGDPFLADYLTKKYGTEKTAPLIQQVDKIKKQFRSNIGQAINNKRAHWVDELVDITTKKQKVTLGQFSKAFGRLSRHPVFGIPILIFFLLITFMLVVHVAGFLDEILSATIVGPTIGFIEGLFQAEDGAIKHQFWYDFLVGHYGILTLGLFNAIVTVLPILSVFFLMFGFLEDIGYMPNLCVLVKRIFGKIGLTGKAVMPLVLALGCKTMATLFTKSLNSRKEKFIAVYLIAFAIPCAAQLGVDMGIIGKLGNLRLLGFVIAYGTLAIVEIGVGFLLNKVIKDDEKSSFIQELPAIRVPNPKAIIVKTYYRLYWFLKEALPIFIIAAAALFFVDKIGLLDLTKTALSPVVVGWLGLPIDIVDALILSLARHEAAAGLLLNMVDSGALNFIQCVVAVTITTMFVPCFANIVAMCKQMGVKTGLAMVVAINISSFILAGILNWILVFTLGRWNL